MDAADCSHSRRRHCALGRYHRLPVFGRPRDVSSDVHPGAQMLRPCGTHRFLRAATRRADAPARWASFSRWLRSGFDWLKFGFCVALIPASYSHGGSFRVSNFRALSSRRRQKVGMASPFTALARPTSIAKFLFPVHRRTRHLARLLEIPTIPRAVCEPPLLEKLAHHRALVGRWAPPRGRGRFRVRIRSTNRISAPILASTSAIVAAPIFPSLLLFGTEREKNTRQFSS